MAVNVQLGQLQPIQVSTGAAKLIQGPKGETGNGIASAILNGDYTLTLVFTDGSAYTTPPIRGAQGIQGVQGIQGAKGDTGSKGDTGAKGDTGNGIASAVLNSDYTLTMAFTDGTTYTTPSIRGVQGAQGIQGEPGTNGLDGAAATVAIGTVTTGEPGTQVQVTNSGTESAAVLNFTIPRGDTGAAGAGTGDMLASVYDPQGKARDVFAYVDDEITAIPAPDVSGQIEVHNTAKDAHANMGFLTMADEELSTPVAIDADTLEGYNAAHFAAAADLTAHTGNAAIHVTAAEKTAWDGKQAAMTAGVDYQAPLAFDSVPTAGSVNPVTSAGVYAALAAQPYEKLISITTESSVAQVDLDLTSLDMTKYSKLELIAEIMPQYTGATLGTISLAMILNGDSGNNYYSVSSSSSSTTAATYIELSPSLSRRYEVSNTCAACDVDILPQHNSVGIYAKYSVTNISTSGGSINGVVGGFRSGLYKDSNFQNITSISLLFSDSGNFGTGSKITLLGIRK